MSAYVQDTFTRNKLTLKVGLRWDRQWNEALRVVGAGAPVRAAVAAGRDVQRG